jgi:hypothetical protein
MTMSVVELAPIVKTVDVRCSTVDAFHLFTARISEWWPMATHTRAKTAEGQKTVRVTVEPRVGGRIYETLNTGEELDWGEVLIFEPGKLFKMAWRLGRPATETTDVSVRFNALSDASCRVTLTHENWERMGAEAERLRNAYNGGWAAVFEKGFGDFAGKL